MTQGLSLEGKCTWIQSTPQAGKQQLQRDGGSSGERGTRYLWERQQSSQGQIMEGLVFHAKDLGFDPKLESLICAPRFSSDCLSEFGHITSPSEHQFPHSLGHT